MTHVLLIAYSVPGADGQNALLPVAQVARRRARGSFPFMLPLVELLVTSVTCYRPLAAQMCRAPCIASGPIGVSGAGARRNAKAALEIDTGMRLCSLSMAERSAKVRQMRTDRSERDFFFTCFIMLGSTAFCSILLDHRVSGLGGRRWCATPTAAQWIASSMSGLTGASALRLAALETGRD